MLQSRLNHIMMLNVHNDRTDNLNLIDVANDFVHSSSHRLELFDRFQESDKQKKNVSV